MGWCILVDSDCDGQANVCSLHDYKSNYVLHKNANCPYWYIEPRKRKHSFVMCCNTVLKPRSVNIARIEKRVYAFSQCRVCGKRIFIERELETREKK
jgi:hypothetical protein